MNYYNEIKNKIIYNEIYNKVKDYSKERNKVITYFDIGRLLNEAGGKYGDKIIDEYSRKLVIEVGKKYNRRTLYRMKQFYNVFSNEKVSTLWTQITWSHIRLLFNLDVYSINYYIQVIIYQHISVRELEFKIKNKEYERLDEKTKIKLKEEKNNLEVKDLIKEPILIKNKGNYEVISEKILKQLILENIDDFLLELGNGFSYIANEYKIKLGDRYNYIDLLLFNIKFNCYVVVELKIIELKKEHIGQIQTYMNYIDKNLKTINQDKTIGIIIVRKNNKFIMEYCSDKRILAKEYELYYKGY